jgi:hypothetical protein
MRQGGPACGGAVMRSLRRSSDYERASRSHRPNTTIVAGRRNNVAISLLRNVPRLR